MTRAESDRIFGRTISEIYEKQLVPLLFQPYATDLAERVASIGARRVLELAAGTGVLTRAMATRLPPSVAITATDLNQAMLDEAIAAGTQRPVEWRQADAMRLPFEDESVDAVVCQFGAMFFPDKPAAFSEAHRVIRPGGTFLFSVWDRIEENEFAALTTTALESVFPADPPRFLARTPHGYFDRHAIAQDLARGSFTATPSFTTIAARSRAASPLEPAIAYCHGTPLRNEIEARDPARLGEATSAAAEAIARRFGNGAVDGKIQAYVVSVNRGPARSA